MSLDYLRPYCETERQTEILEAVIKHGSYSKAGRKLGHYDHKTVSKSIKRLKRKAELQGHSPEHELNHPIPETQYLKGSSTLYKDGEAVLQWVKTNAKLDSALEVMRETCEALKEDLPHYTPVNEPETDTLEQLVNQYTITDYHFGMLAWGEETGADWDLDIAEKLLINWFKTAIECSPDSEVGIFAQIGDYLHFDSMAAITPQSGHLLDADTRFQKLVRVAIRATRAVIDMLLAKHKRVHVIMAAGNHDLASSVWMREMLAHVYDNEPRITVDLSPDIYYSYEWGKTSLFYHHGHKRNPKNISQVFASKFRDLFGRTEYSYGHTGHLHSNQVVEDNLMIIEQHATLTAPDAYAGHGGWNSMRGAQVITYHKDYGKVGSLNFTPEMVA